MLQSIEESFEGWRSGDEVNVEWAADGWGNSASLFVNATERDKRTCWLAYRAFVDGAPVEDIQRHYEKVPSHLLLPLAELSSYAVARKFTFTPALDESDVLAELAAKVLDSNEDDLESIAASAYMTQNALYTALFYHGRAMGPRLNKLVTTAHNLFSASEEYLTRQRIDATPVVEPLSKAFKLNTDYLFTNTSAYPVHRYWTLTTTAADLPPQQLDEWNDFLRRINFVRACAGKQLISTAFKTKGDYEVFSTTLEGLRTRTMDTDFFAGFLHGDFNRASPTFSGARVEVKCFSDNGAVALPNNQHVPEGLKTNADVPGNF
ncbi:MAG: hypothetical protein U5N86_05450 [Planctomycetota bacterium]|nr:hypothetical protein [Planctomycetota bacterium]